MTERQPFGALLLFAGLLVAGCPRPQSTIPQLRGVSPRALLSTLEREAAAHRQAVGAVHIDYLALDGLFRGDADVAVARDARIRIELRSFFGQPAFALAADGARFVFVDNTRTSALRGPVTSPRLAEVLPLPVPAPVSVALLLGSLPPLEPGGTRYVRPQGDGDLAIEHRQSRETWTFEIGEGGHPLLAATYARGDEPAVFRAQFHDHRQVAGVTFPNAGELQLTGREGAIRWRWTDVQLNGPALDESIWSLTVPPGYSVEDLAP